MLFQIFVAALCSIGANLRVVCASSVCETKANYLVFDEWLVRVFEHAIALILGIGVVLNL
jgi:hypothetical protein